MLVNELREKISCQALLRILPISQTCLIEEDKLSDDPEKKHFIHDSWNLQHRDIYRITSGFFVFFSLKKMLI